MKQKWSLSVDPAEKAAPRNLLTSCGAVPPTTTTTTTAPPPVTHHGGPVAVAPTPANDCTPGYGSVFSVVVRPVYPHEPDCPPGS